MELFLFILSINTIIKYYLEIRNQRYIQNHKNQLPDKFKQIVTLKEHIKAADYSSAKTKAGYIFRVFNLAILLIWTIGGGLNYINEQALSISNNFYLQGIILFLIFFTISTVLSLPESIYSTFIIEEKFGFNKTTTKTFLLDLVKSLLLNIIIIIPILFVMLYIIESLGTYWWIYCFIFLSLVQFTLMYLYPRVIAPIFNKFSPLEDGELKNEITSLLNSCDFKNSGIFIMDASRRSTQGNAYFTGFGKNKRIVFFDTLVKNLTNNEIIAILAHELGHFKKRHIHKSLLISLFLSFIAFYILSILINSQPFLDSHGVTHNSKYLTLLLFTIVAGVYTFWMTPIFSYFSRKNEFEADAFASENTDAHDLISALIKLYKENASTLTPDPLYSKFYHSHPPAKIRIDYLESLSSKKPLVKAEQVIDH